MPELLPARQVHFRHESGAVVAGWALFYNPDTEVLEVEWTDPLGFRTVSYVEAARLLPAAARSALTERLAPAARKAG
jgi:hypothetical protein